MTDTTQGNTSSRARVSRREYLTATGEKSVGPDSAGNVIFHLLGDDPKAAPIGSFSWKELTDDVKMQFSQFGFVTKVGNVANSVLNGDDPGSRQDAAGAIEEWLDALTEGQWREPGEGGPRGPKFDKDVLTSALLAELGSKAAGGADHYRAKLDDKAYYAKVRVNPKVMARYHQEMAAKATGDVDSLA